MRRANQIVRSSSRLFLTLGVLLGAMALLGGCHPGSKDVTETDIVVTTLVDDTGFGTLKTYAMPNEVRDLGDIQLQSKTGDAGLEAETAKEIDRETQDLILSRIADNMESLGYERDNDPQESNPPDLILIPAAQVKTGTAIGGGTCYPGYYPPYWGWGWCYPPVVYEFSVGTVVFGLLDSKEPEGGEDATFKWFAGINGGLASSTSTNTQRVVQGIDQAFSQSPYLRVKTPESSK